jgi:hypothetical protein
VCFEMARACEYTQICPLALAVFVHIRKYHYHMKNQKLDHINGKLRAHTKRRRSYTQTGLTQDLKNDQTTGTLRRETLT